MPRSTNAKKGQAKTDDVMRNMTMRKAQTLLRNGNNLNKTTRQKLQEFVSSGSGRSSNSAFSANRATDFNTDTQTMRDAWREGREVQTVTRSASGKMSANGRTAGGETWTFTNKDDEGNKVRQSGRSTVSNRRQRYYDVRVGMNNVTQKALDRARELVQQGVLSQEEFDNIYGGAAAGGGGGGGLSTG